MPAVVVYAGPTIPAADVRAVLPHAEVLPPVARGDLLDRRWQPGDAAVLIDGYFRERRSVGHKEILRLIAGGVHVVGAASMGALRAAELAPCGMRGVGDVYAMYASGEIDGDDEVGMLHGPADHGYPARTVALVNLRHGCRAGAADGRVPPAAGDRIVAAAKAMPFTARTWEDLERAVPETDRAAVRALAAGIASGEWDLKRHDATAALHAVASRDASPAAAPAVTFPGLSDHQALIRRSRREYAPGRFMSDMDVLDAARLFDPDHPALHERVLGTLLDDIAAAHGQTAPAYAAARLGVHGTLPDPLAAWLTDAETARLGPGEQARLVALRVWPVWHSADWRPAVVAALRAADGWDRWCDVVARAGAAADETRFRLSVPPPATCAKLFLRHWRGPGTSPRIEMARRGFASMAELGGAVRRFFAYDVQRNRSAR